MAFTMTNESFGLVPAMSPQPRTLVSHFADWAHCRLVVAAEYPQKTKDRQGEQRHVSRAFGMALRSVRPPLHHRRLSASARGCKDDFGERNDYRQ